MLPQSDPSHKGRQAEAGVDNSKYCMEPGKPLLLFRAYKLTLKREEMYSSLNSGWEHSDGASHDTRYWEGGIERDGHGEAERRGKIKYSTGKQPGIWHMRCGGRERMDLETQKTRIEYIPTHFTGLAHMFMDASGKCCRKNKIIEVKLPMMQPQQGLPPGHCLYAWEDVLYCICRRVNGFFPLGTEICTYMIPRWVGALRNR